MQTKSKAPVNKNLFYGFFVGVFGGALIANIVAGVNNAATTALLIVTLAVAVIGVALVAFKNDERITVLEDPDDAILNGKISEQVSKIDPDDVILNEKISEQVKLTDPDDVILNEKIAEQVHKLDGEKSAS